MIQIDATAWARNDRDREIEVQILSVYRIESSILKRPVGRETRRRTLRPGGCCKQPNARHIIRNPLHGITLLNRKIGVGQARVKRYVLNGDRFPRCPIEGDLDEERVKYTPHVATVGIKNRYGNLRCRATGRAPVVQDFVR